jgi:DNA-binding ferritin-like protein
MINQHIAWLIGVRSNAHLAHWATTSYATHKALGKFYEGLDSLTDTLVETYQGRYQRIAITDVITLKAGDPVQLVDEAYKVAGMIENVLEKEDTDLLNIIADIKGLCNHTKYLLTLD